jgi:hypothetical protein
LSKLSSTVRIANVYSRQSQFDILQRIDEQVNALSEGRLAASYNAALVAPTTGTYSAGDFIRNSAPAEAGGAGSKYVIFGFLCTVSGTPGTWIGLRALTGN